jgi:hypothetical protein
VLILNPKGGSPPLVFILFRGYYPSNSLSFTRVEFFKNPPSVALVPFFGALVKRGQKRLFFVVSLKFPLF